MTTVISMCMDAVLTVYLLTYEAEVALFFSGMKNSVMPMG